MKIIRARVKSGFINVLVDDEDFEILNKFRWFTNGKAGYVVRNGSKRVGGKMLRKPVYMHREVINASTGTIVDHINRDVLDNRKANLRFVTKSENALNSKIAINNTSGYRGVYYWKPRNVWSARIRENLREKHIGYFATKEEAINARRQAEFRQSLASRLGT